MKNPRTAAAKLVIETSPFATKPYLWDNLGGGGGGVWLRQGYLSGMVTSLYRKSASWTISIKKNEMRNTKPTSLVRAVWGAIVSVSDYVHVPCHCVLCVNIDKCLPEVSR